MDDNKAFHAHDSDGEGQTAGDGAETPKSEPSSAHEHKERSAVDQVVDKIHELAPVVGERLQEGASKVAHKVQEVAPVIGEKAQEAAVAVAKKVQEMAPIVVKEVQAGVTRAGEAIDDFRRRGAEHHADDEHKDDEGHAPDTKPSGASDAEGSGDSSTAPSDS